MANVITRRSFMKAGAQAAAAAGLASMVNIPLFLQQALAQGNIDIAKKKLLFIFLRGGNDGLNNIIPIQDPSYQANRALIGLPKDPDVFYDVSTGQCDDPGLVQPYAIRLGNGFAALNPNLYDLAPLFNTGKLALLHRVAYRSQSRSHFDSEKYWEKAADGVAANNRLISDGIFYRAIVEGGWNQGEPLSGVSIQPNMPQSLRGQQPMTNLSSIDRYNLLGASGNVSTATICPGPPAITFTSAADRLKLLNAITAANSLPHPDKDNRERVYDLSRAFQATLDEFRDCDFLENNIYDSDGITNLFPTETASDNRQPSGNRLGNGAYGFFKNLKAAAQVLGRTGAIISGTEMGGFDTHTGQVTAGSPHLGGHGNLLRRIGWAFYALSKFFSNPAYSPRVRWEDVVVVTMSEFGRTSAQNASMGTDHAEASVMYVAGGSVNGGVYGCSETTLNGIKQWDPGDGGKNGSMFQANASVGYLKRAIDYRSVFGEIIRDHLGATPDQLNKIIPAYANETTEHLKNGGTVGTIPIIGELNLV
jgi:uncharacterized protein (DUF1501 family)